MSKGLTVAFLFFAGLYLVALNFDVAFFFTISIALSNSKDSFLSKLSAIDLYLLLYFFIISI